MRKLQKTLKDYSRNILILFRDKKGLTQEQLAALLHISDRSYSDLECGHSCVSALTLIHFLGLLPDKEILEIIHGFQAIAAEMEKKEAVKP